ncbi:MAG: hypothetical protein EBT83_10645, partial [Betaproteobacteria bacterium]|nr:hypothetical protein [Betaproteobacteria bacterium]
KADPAAAIASAIAAERRHIGVRGLRLLLCIAFMIHLLLLLPCRGDAVMRGHGAGRAPSGAAIRRNAFCLLRPDQTSSP